jgi:MFS family permease
VLAGLVADRFGRKPVFIAAVALQCLLVLPAYLVIGRAPHAVTIYAAIAVLSALQVAMDVTGLLIVSESLPKRVRSGSLSILYAVALAIFGGSMQFIAKALLDVTGNSLAPAFYVTAALALCAVAMLRMRETSPRHAVS